jgi:AraC-like DNA-binding protein
MAGAYPKDGALYIFTDEFNLEIFSAFGREIGKDLFIFIGGNIKMGKIKITSQAVDYILTRKNEELGNLDVENVAKGIGADRSYLSRNFKIEQEISLNDFILREKIYRAVFLLEKSHDISIEELSNKLGFRKVEDFVKEFSSIIAIEPDKYRNLRKAATNLAKECL